jgi:putative N-acetyltransferase (TIGR04045 family)
MSDVTGVIFRAAETPVDLEDYFRLRRQVFVEEQKIFAATDVDEFDSGAVHLIALEELSGKVVGGVRVYRREGDTWLGGRLAVDSAYRRSQVGAKLVKLAIETVKAAGCKEFFAYVQVQNVGFFERLGWRVRGRPVVYHGLSHQLMEASL